MHTRVIPFRWLNSNKDIKVKAFLNKSRNERN